MATTDRSQCVAVCHHSIDANAVGFFDILLLGGPRNYPLRDMTRDIYDNLEAPFNPDLNSGDSRKSSCVSIYDADPLLK